MKLASRQKPSWRFSMGTMLLVIALLATIASHVHTSLKLRRAEHEAASLRNELGYLTISDPDQIHALALPTFEGMQWRWRIHLPSGNQYRIRWSAENIPADGLPKESSYDDITFSRVPAEPFILTVALHRDHLGAWRIAWEHPEHNSSIPLKAPRTDCLETPTGRGYQIAGKGETESADPDEPFVLVRVRRSKQVPGGVTVDPDPTDGVMVWIEGG